MHKCRDCGSSMMQKVSVINKNSMFRINYASTTTDINYDFKSNFNINLSNSTGNALMQNDLGSQFRPPIKPEEPKKEIFLYSFIGGMIGAIIAGYINVETPINNNLFGAVIGIIYIIIGVHVAKHFRNITYNKTHNSYINRLEIWQEEYGDWEKTYFCHQCGKKYIPEHTVD